jgi:hypothetical protein
MKYRIHLVEHESWDASSPLPQVTLRVYDRYDMLANTTFRIDTGADLTTLSVSFARRHGIPFTTDAPSRARGMVGVVTSYPGEIKIVLGGREHVWPCLFVDSPTELDPVLGRAGFLDEYACAIDDGFLIITRLGPVRRFLRRCLHLWWRITSQVHDADQPL